MARGASLTPAESQRIRELMQQSARNVQQRPSRVKSAPNVPASLNGDGSGENRDKIGSEIDDSGKGGILDEPAAPGLAEDTALNFEDLYAPSPVGRVAEMFPDMAINTSKNPMLEVASAGSQSSLRLNKDVPGQLSSSKPANVEASGIAPRLASTTFLSESSEACESSQGTVRSRPHISLKVAASAVLAANKIKRNVLALSSVPQLPLTADSQGSKGNPLSEDESGVWATIIDKIDLFFEVQIRVDFLLVLESV